MPRIRRPATALAALVVAGLILAPGGVAPLTGAPVARAADACPSGWARTSESAQLALQDVLKLPGDRAIAVGTERRAFGDRRWAISRWDGTDWLTRLGPRGADGALLGVAGTPPEHLWAVGFRDKGLRAVPFALHQAGARWVVDSPPTPAAGAQVLSAVDVDPGGGVWAVGMAVDARPSRNALVWRHTGAGWKRVTRLPVGRRTALSGVLARSSRDVWAVGSEGGAHGIRPLILHWDGRSWSSQRIVATSDEAVLSGIDMDVSGQVWAVGWDRVAGALVPLVLRLDHGTWVDVGGPDVGGALSLGTDVSLDADGRVWVVGTVYRPANDQYLPIAARLDTEGWLVWPRPPGTGRYLNAVSGDLAGAGWATGRAEVGTIKVRACEPAAGLASVSRRGAGHVTIRAGTTTDEEPASDRLPPPVRGLAPVAALPAPAALPDIAVNDDAHVAGIDITGLTHGATVADLDGDGRRDLFISGHGGPAILFLKRDNGNGYVLRPRFLPHRDRHDCDVLKVDTGPHADIICSIGSDHGLGIKANELWIDPASGVATDEAAVRGIADPVGRGRDIAVFDADGDGDPDLFLGNLGLRYDGQPTPNKLMRNDGTGHFTWDPDSGLTSDRGSWCAVPVDADLDGDTDLLLCGRTGDILDIAKVVLYRNDGTGHFRDVTAATGIRPIGEVDAEMAQLGGSDRPDLVQLSVDRLRISLWQDGRYVKVFERSVTHGRALAVGDVNGDGANDLYIQMGSTKVNDPDVVLVNDGTGRHWTPMDIPSTSAGTAEDVVPLDWDANGLTDFLVLNGWTKGGPIQLISFNRTGGAGPR